MMPHWLKNDNSESSVFNTPLECGLRSTILLLAAFPAKYDLQRLLQYDYLMVHSADVPDGPSSIHPATPLRVGELLVRRPLIERGIKMMMSRSVIECDFSQKGVYYYAGEWALSFIGMLSTDYVKQLQESAQWTVNRFQDVSDEKLDNFMRTNWANWGAEFELESFVRTGTQ